MLLGFAAAWFLGNRNPGGRSRSDVQVETLPASTTSPIDQAELLTAATPGTPVGGDPQASATVSPLALQARQVLEAKCHRCHGAGGSDEGGFNFLLRRDRLVNAADGSAMIVPGDSANSYLYERILSGEMPPEGEGEALTDAEKQTIRDWIEAGAPDFNAAEKRTFVSTEDVLRFIRNDLLVRTPERDRQFVRYFTLTHLYNAGLSADEMQTYRNALTKLLNSLSWNRRLIEPESLDPPRTVLRIDLRDLEWTNEVWRKIVKANPYAVVHASPLATLCQEATDCQVPMVRADWFVSAASHPPLYHEVLQLPDTLKELEEQLRVDTASNIKRERATRAGFARSGVSQNNRLIERHDSPYGAYWISYDFSGNTGRKNLFQHPLGPGTESGHFEHDGGEVIFNLPNGLQGYLLVDADGKRIDKGPTSIVSDPRRPDRAVVNGISCMSCHYAGIIRKEDEIRRHVQANLAAYPEADDILALYPTADRLTELQDADARRFREALSQIGIDRLTATSEPVTNMALRFESNLDVKLAAAEFGLSSNELITLLPSFPKLARILGSLRVPGGTVKREVFVQVFSEAARSLGFGEPFNDSPDNGTTVASNTDTPPKTTPAAPAAEGTPPASGSTGQPAEAAGTDFGSAKQWTSSSGKPIVVAEFVSFEDGSTVKLKNSEGIELTLDIDQLSQADQQFILQQSSSEPLADLPDAEPGLPGATTPPRGTPPGGAPPTGTPPRGRPVVGRPVKNPNLRVWTPTDGKREPFEAEFLGLEPGGLVKLKLPYGIVVRGPLEMLSPADKAYIRERTQD